METAAPKSCLGKILTLLAFGPVSLRLLDLGVPEASKVPKQFGWMATCLDLRKYFSMLPWSMGFARRWAWFKDPRRDGGTWRFKCPPPQHG